MRNLKAIIAYDGTRYSGWQNNKNASRTIQGEIEGVLSELLNEKIEVMASGRTDAGVHAMGQVVNFTTSCEKPLPDLLAAINKNMPDDICVKKLVKESDRFHARYNAKSKVYLYRILNTDVPNPFLRKFTYHYSKELNTDLMERAAQYIVGTHDFLGFSSGKKLKKSTERTIYKIEIKKMNNELQILIHGDGFLYNMARIIVGTLIEVSEGKLKPDDIAEIIQKGKRESAGFTAPPYGLFLYEVFYN